MSTTHTHVDLQSKAMLVALRLSFWTAKKRDKRVTEETRTRYNVSDKYAGEWRKSLVAEESLKKLSKIAGRARQFVYDNTLPWEDKGWRILSSARFVDFERGIDAIIAEYDAEADVFCDLYPSLVEQAKYDLNGTFDPNDYPPVEKVRAKYRCRIDYAPVPSAEDFRVEIAEEQVAHIQNEILVRTNEQLQLAMQNIWERIEKVVSLMVERLRAKEQVRWHTSLVTNIQELAQMIPNLNLTDDEDLNELSREMDEKLCRFTADELKQNPRKRAKTAREAEEILNRIKGYTSLTA